MIYQQVVDIWLMVCVGCISELTGETADHLLAGL